MTDLEPHRGVRQPPVDEWDQREHEPDTLYDLFRQYLGLGPGRDLDDLATTTGAPKHHLAGASAAWDWRRRALAYDRHEQHKLAAERHAARDRAAGRATSAALAALETAEGAIRSLDPAMVTARDAADLLSAGSGAARWALGDPNSYTRASSDPLSTIAAGHDVPVADRVRAASALERRDTTEEADEHDREVVERVEQALADDGDQARAVAAALSCAGPTEPGSVDDERAELAAELDEIMRHRE